METCALNNASVNLPHFWPKLPGFVLGEAVPCLSGSIRMSVSEGVLLMSEEECIEIIERIYGGKKDVTLPSREGEQPITLLASRKGYHMQAAYEPVSYEGAKEVFDALFAYYQVVEDDPLDALQQDLEHVA